jgi:gamma-glutamyltranspeptidase/glutathione hydrolase
MASGLSAYRPQIMGVTHMVSAGHYLATGAGYRILEQGGNAVDAGVATGIALNVILPWACGFGGVAPIVIYDAGKDEVITISGLGRWPKAASIDYFMEHAGGEIPSGILRCVTPAAADAWMTALETYGTMTFEEVVGPALELAAEGFPVPEFDRTFLDLPAETEGGEWVNWPSTAEIFMPDGRPLREGEPLVQADLATTFRRLIEVEKANALKGRAGAVRAARDFFYKGDIAEEMVRFAQQQRGLLTMEDMGEFAVKLEKPVKGTYRDYQVYTCGPWCQGPVVAQTLQMLSDDDLISLGHNSADYIHLLVESLKLAFADRHHYYGDPDLVDVPIDGLLSPGYTAERRGLVDMGRAHPEMPHPGDPWPYQREPGDRGAVSVPEATGGRTEQDTTYVCVVDRWGNAFSATPSDPFYDSPVVPGLGFAISSRGSQTWLEPGHPSGLQPWKRPRLTPNPAMAFKDGKLFMPFGTPGGDSQCQSMVQAFLNATQFGMDPQRAIEEPRFVSWSFPNSFWPHAYQPGRLVLEGRIPADVAQELSKRGHRIELEADWTPRTGAVCMILVDQGSGVLKGGADPRRSAYAMGR